MAQQTYVTITDDLDGSPATRTIRFGFEGKAFVIDLNDANAAAFAELMTRYISYARPDVEVALPLQPTRRAKETKQYSPKVVREWAQKQGLEVGDRGRISDEVLQAYLAANGG